MSEMIQFVANYDDLSTDRGWQFRFHCDKCGNGHMSAYEAYLAGKLEDAEFSEADMEAALARLPEAPAIA